jgi:rare lipoprotein A
MKHAHQHSLSRLLALCILFSFIVAACGSNPKPRIYRIPSGATGMASWYGPGFQGNLTANGERYDMNGISAAHKTLPFGTVVRVTNLNNGRSIDVRINDRGPFIKNRVIDLSKGAAQKIDMIRDGVVPVRLQILTYGPN